MGLVKKSLNYLLMMLNFYIPLVKLFYVRNIFALVAAMSLIDYVTTAKWFKVFF